MTFEWDDYKARSRGGNYQTLINAALRMHIDSQAPNDREGLEEKLRRVIREEFPPYKPGGSETP